MARMDEGYFEEKKESALLNLGDSVSHIVDVIGFIRTKKYSLPDIVAPDEIHAVVTSAIESLKAATVDFEKARWAAADTDVEFDQWIINQIGRKQ